jgi:phosphoribosylamine--glycine ligase
MEDGRIVTSGGRVLNVVAVAPDFWNAHLQAYAAAKRIEFAGKDFRTDIAYSVIGM